MRDRTAPVIVGVDGSPASAAAVELAVAAAAVRGTRLVVVHAVPRGVRADPVDPARAAVARLRATYPDLPVSAESLAGEPAEVLARRSRDAGLLVVGHRGRCGYAGLHVGSVAMRVICLAEVPVMVYRPLDNVATDPRPVLAAIEPATADSVLRFAFLETSLRGASLLAISVPASGAQGCDDLDDVLSRWSGKYPDVPVRLVARRGVDAAVVLTAASRSAQLVVIGLAGAGSATRLLNGSVSRVLVHRAGCPVAVVPTD